jgi:DNA replication protein DnaC
MMVWVRSLERAIASVAGVDWIRAGHNLLIIGATGLGKSWLAVRWDKPPAARA